MEVDKDIYKVPPSNLVRLDVSVHRAQLQELREIARKTGRSVSDLVREGIAVILTAYGGLK